MATKFVTVGIDIMHDQNLSQSQKFILAEIEQLSSLEKGCFASNQHFSELIGIAKESVSRSINNLQKKGYIDIEIKAGSRNHDRLLTLNKTSRPPKQNVKTPLTKHQETKENKTSNIHINIQDGVNTEAFKMWCKYKGSKYSKQAQILSMNKLVRFDEYTQKEMVEAAIINGWKGLFEIKTQTAFKGKEPEVGSYAWRMKQQQNEIDVEVM